MQAVAEGPTYAFHFRAREACADWDNSLYEALLDRVDARFSDADDHCDEPGKISVRIS